MRTTTFIWLTLSEVSGKLPRDWEILYRVQRVKEESTPEDCGGIRGYEELLDVLKSPDHERYEEVVEWIGEDFDPDRFDAGGVHFTDPEERFRSAFR